MYTQGAETVEVDEFKDLRSTIQSNRQCAKEVTMHGGAGEDEQQGRRRKSSSEREALQYSRDSLKMMALTNRRLGWSYARSVLM